ncbi:MULTISPECIES: hypothetical protein [unclassified Variovorax]|uniref:hypothetical protein n=1 Tax=unclassified Variovorax TaxID=663243 RepID=UPI0008C030E2|nr:MULTISPECIES: hypothetical protein [unclassified Variovorax]SEJ15659.1 hypothetical protein SAMN05518853_101807 [Variovorax sp. OK202]SFC06266.1 hypothetical protein SAMN05444746_101807 [Variovorax sp. OK212]
MNQDRIFFTGNPWPEGHPVKEFRWTAAVRDGQVRFDLHLRSDDYEAEREIEDPEEEDETEDGEYIGDWQSVGVWTNYHRCTLSSTHWGAGDGLAVCAAADYSLDMLDGLEIVVDDPPPEDIEQNFFHIYLLGHDAAAAHRIRFDRIAGTERFNVTWTGKIALAYAGDNEYKYEFAAHLYGVEAPRLPA